MIMDVRVDPRARLLAAVVLVLLGTSACGGGSHDPTPADLPYFDLRSGSSNGTPECPAATRSARAPTSSRSTGWRGRYATAPWMRLSSPPAKDCTSRVRSPWLPLNSWIRATP